MHEDGTDSRIKIFANIFISFIGAGILGLPYAFKEAGLVEGILVMSGVGAVSVKAMLLLIDCKDKLALQSSHSLTEKGLKNKNKSSPSPTARTFIDYGDVGQAALGVWGKWLVDIAIIISQIGFCCAYLIFISENLYSVFPKISQLWYLITLLVPLIFLTNLRHLNHLAPFSIFADFANIFAYGIVFYFDMEHFHLIGYGFLNCFHISNYSIEGLPFFLGVAIYCFEGAGLILSLEGSVAKEAKSSFRPLFKFAIFCTTTLYVVFGVCGYLSFGQDTESIITLNLPQGLFPFVVKGCLCFSLFFTYPIMMFPVSNILERMFCHHHTNNSDQTYTNYMLGCVLRSLLVIISGLVVLCIPNFSTMMALVGSSCCTLLAFILPGIFHLKLFQGEMNRWSLGLDVFLILLGIVGTIIGTRDALSRLYGDKTTSQIPSTVATPTAVSTLLTAITNRNRTAGSS